MAFLGHLLIIAGALAWLCCLLAFPRPTLLWSMTLGCGALGSSEGFLGTVAGLALGSSTYCAGYWLVFVIRKAVGAAVRADKKAEESGVYSAVGMVLMALGVAPFCAAMVGLIAMGIGREAGISGDWSVLAAASPFAVGTYVLVMIHARRSMFPQRASASATDAIRPA